MRTLLFVAAAAPVVLLGCGGQVDAGGTNGTGGAGGGTSTVAAAFTLQTDATSVAPGTETQICYFMKVPSSDPLWIHRIVATQAPGSHHLNVFRVKTVKNLGGNDGDKVVDGECWKSPNWSDWPLVINSQEAGDVDWTLPDGVAHRFEPGELLMVQSHYVNATTQMTPGIAQAQIAFYPAPAGETPMELGTAFATDQSISVCPGQVDASAQASCLLSSDQPVTIVAANGHFHSRGKRFTMQLFDAQTGAADTSFYTSTSWSEPLMARDLSVVVPPGGGFEYKCEYDVPSDACGDPTKMCCFTFGPKVETNEHCNAFVYYYPRGASDVRCFLRRRAVRGTRARERMQLAEASAPHTTVDAGPLSVEMGVFTTEGQPMKMIADGDPVDLWNATQGGHVLLVGGRVTGMSGTIASVRGRLRDASTNAIVAEEERTVALVPTDDGAEQTNPALRSQFANIPVCPDGTGRGMLAPYVLELTVTDSNDLREVTVTKNVTPSCEAVPDADQALCACECAPNYVLGACPTPN